MYSRLRKALQNKDKGFTLIELLVVIIIIGILAAIAIPIFLSQRSKATDASEKSDVRTVATEMETFFTDAQTYPAAANITTAVGPPVSYTIGGDKVVMSSGNTATIKLNAAAATATSYCITVTNSQTSDVFTWDSLNGGLQPKGVACPAGYATAVL